MKKAANLLTVIPFITLFKIFVFLMLLLGIAVRLQSVLAGAAGPDIQLASGYGTACVLVDGGLRCWGNAAGTGTGSGMDVPVPTQASGLAAGVQSVELGSGFGCAILDDGGVKCWGGNNMGQLGNGTTNASLTPVSVIGLPDDAKHLAVGATHACVLLNNEQVWCWGNNANYQLGREGWSDSTPTQVSSPFGGTVVELGAGAAHTCARLSSGGVQCWGYGYYGSLGNGTSGNSADTPIPQTVLNLAGKAIRLETDDLHSCVLLENGAVQCWGMFASFNQTKATSLTAFGSGNTEIAAGGDHVCVLDINRKARCLGSGTSGQLGDGSKTNSSTPVSVSLLGSGISAIDAGLAHTCAVWGGQVYCWGGILGAGAARYAASPWKIMDLPNPVQKISGGATHACSVANGAAFCWGSNYGGALGNGLSNGQTYLTPQSVTNASSNVTQISAGIQYSCAVIGGAAKCWGSNLSGQLGTGDKIESSTPVQVSGLTSGVQELFTHRGGSGDSFTCANVGGVAYCWGINSAGQVGCNSTNTYELTPKQVTGLTSGVTSIAVGGRHACAAANGSAYCWGLGYYGEIGNGVSGTYDKYRTPQSVSGLGSGVTQVASGDNFACALVNGGVKCWGRNHAGQLGDGTTTDSATPVQVNGLTSGVSQISAISNYACALSGGAVKCWGSAPTSTTSSPVPVRGMETGVLEISAGSGVLLARTADGAVSVGSNTGGLLGTPVENALAAPKNLLGYGPSPELRIQAANAKPGSTLQVAGGGFPPNTRLPLYLNGQLLGSIFSDGFGYFSIVLDTQGKAEGAYTLQVISKGTTVQTSFNLAGSAALEKTANGGVLFSMSAAVPEPTPRPSPTPNPNATPPPSTAPSISQVVPNSGDRTIPVRVDIYGSNFQPGAVARLLQSGTEISALETQYITHNHLQATWPSGLVAAPHTVVVINPDWYKGELASGYLPFDVAAGSGTDLYGFDYELGPETPNPEEGANVNFNFVVHRLGGTGNLSNVKVSFYYGDSSITNPITQGTLMANVNIPSLAPNQWAFVQTNYPAPAAGGYQLFAVIDSTNQAVEIDENNNIVRSWFTVVPSIVPVDSVPPVIDSVSASGLWTSSSYTELTVSAHDNPGGSGVGWVYVYVWEYLPGLRDWIATEEYGWMSYQPGAASQTYSIHFGYFEGPRIFTVYVADQAENTSLNSMSTLINYVKPNNFIFPGESHLFAFPLRLGEHFGASLQNQFPDNDADLYLWPPDYPGRPYWASATVGSASESINITVPVEGWYWLEVYGYDYSFYNLSVNLASLADTSGLGQPVVPGSMPDTRTAPLALGEKKPSEKPALPPIVPKTCLPVIFR